jgi:hypothetical protein
MIGMDIAKEAPQLCVRMNNVAQMGKGCVGRNGEPVAHGLPVNRRLLFQVVSNL